MKEGESERKGNFADPCAEYTAKLDYSFPIRHSFCVCFSHLFSSFFSLLFHVSFAKLINICPLWLWLWTIIFFFPCRLFLVCDATKDIVCSMFSIRNTDTHSLLHDVDQTTRCCLANILGSLVSFYERGWCKSAQCSSAMFIWGFKAKKKSRREKRHNQMWHRQINQLRAHTTTAHRKNVHTFDTKAERQMCYFYSQSHLDKIDSEREKTLVAPKMSNWIRSIVKRQILQKLFNQYRIRSFILVPSSSKCHYSTSFLTVISMLCSIGSFPLLFSVRLLKK